MREENLLKAISDMEAIAKGESVSPGMSGKGNDTPKTTSQANGGLSGEGDQKELGVSASSPSFAAKGEDEDEEFDFDAFDEDAESTSLADWAQADAVKGGDSDDDESMDDDDDEDDEDDEEDEGEGMTKGKGKSCKKSASLADLMKSDTETGPVMDVAPFLERLVDQVSDSIENQNRAIAQMQSQLTSQHRVLKALGNMQLGLKKSMDGIGEMPVGDRRSVLSKSEIHERFEEEAPDFSKADVLDAMVELAQTGRLDPIAVSRYEATNTMEPEVRKSVEGHLLKKSA